MIDPDLIERLSEKVRAYMAAEAPDIEDDGSNPTDDERPFTLQDLPDNLIREEIAELIQGLDPDEQNELVALMWLGRDDTPASEWENLLQLAKERDETPDEDYLLSHPLLAEYWNDGLQKLLQAGILEAEDSER